jgi:hypothetical protein
MPKKGFREAIALFIGSIKLRDRKFCIAGSNEPTPGKTTASACSIIAGESVIFGTAPTFSKPLQTECRFPMP